MLKQLELKNEITKLSYINLKIHMYNVYQCDQKNRYILDA